MESVRAKGGGHSGQDKVEDKIPKYSGNPRWEKLETKKKYIFHHCATTSSGPKQTETSHAQWRIQGVFWLPEAPPAMIFFNQGVT